MELVTESQLKSLAKDLAMGLQSGDRLFLNGPLGVGKTTFARYILEALGHEKVRSPSFGIIHEFDSEKFQIVHADLYRIEQDREFQEIGLEELLWEKTQYVALVEWINKFPDYYSRIKESSLKWKEVNLRFSEDPERRFFEIYQS